MLEVTPAAAELIQRLLDTHGLGPEQSGGLRLALDQAHGGLTMTVAAAPADADTTLRRHAVTVYLDEHAVLRTRRHVLDVHPGPNGEVLSLLDQREDEARRDRLTVAAIRDYLSRSGR
jgi:hypothetical protein